MTGPLLAEFRDPETLSQALAQVKQARFRALDAFTPYPVEGLFRSNWASVHPPSAR